MKQYNVGLVVEVPDVGATDEQIEEWIGFETGYRAGMETSNPLCDHDMTSNWLEVDIH